MLLLAAAEIRHSILPPLILNHQPVPNICIYIFIRICEFRHHISGDHPVLFMLITMIARPPWPGNRNCINMGFLGISLHLGVNLVEVHMYGSARICTCRRLTTTDYHLSRYDIYTILVEIAYISSSLCRFSVRQGKVSVN